MKQFLTDLGINITLIIAGFIGSIAVEMSRKTKFNWKKSLLSMTLGTLAANYLTPVIVEIFGFDATIQNSIAFLIGYIGLKGVEKITDKYITNKIGD